MRYSITFFVVVVFTSQLAAAEPFEDATQRVGLKGLSGGVAAWGDFDRDGWVDLYVGGQLWRNEGGKRFVRFENSPPSGAGIWADFDNDGFLDLFSWEGGGRLYRNLKGKKFEHLAKAIPPLPQKVSLGAAWGDFDGDGLVDLYIGGYETWTVASYVDVIYRNQGDGTFKETWRSKGGPQPARGITAADYDEDGDLDVYVSNYRLVPNLLWKNDGKGKFTNVAAETGTAGDGGLGAWGHTIGSAWGDLDNDGHLDLFVGNFSHRPAYQDRPKFLKNLGPEGKFRFADKTATAGLRWQESYASPTLGDFDNDGRLDLFFTTVYPGNKSVLYRNAGGWKFTDATAAAKINTAKTYQAAWADFDGDGYLDLVSGGRLLRNPGGKNHWLKVRLVGKGKVNAAAIGAQVRIKLASGTLTRQISSATGQGNQNALVLHFGLGEHSGSVKLQIRWPDGSKQEVKTEIGQATTVVFDQSSEK